MSIWYLSVIPVSWYFCILFRLYIFLYIVLMLNWANHISSTPCFVSASVRWVFAHVLQPCWPVCMQLVCHYVSFYSGRRADVFDLIPLLRRWYYTGPRTTSDLCSRWYSVLPAHTPKFLYFFCHEAHVPSIVRQNQISAHFQYIEILS